MGPAGSSGCGGYAKKAGDTERDEKRAVHARAAAGEVPPQRVERGRIVFALMRRQVDDVPHTVHQKRVELAALLPFGAGELAEEVFVDTPESV